MIWFRYNVNAWWWDWIESGSLSKKNMSPMPSRYANHETISEEMESIDLDFGNLRFDDDVKVASKMNPTVALSPALIPTRIHSSTAYVTPRKILTDLNCVTPDESDYSPGNTEASSVQSSSSNNSSELS